MHTIETDTPILPYIIAGRIVGEVISLISRKKTTELKRALPNHKKVIANQYTILLRQLSNDETLVTYLTDRANTIYTRNKSFRKTIRARGNRGRDTLASFMRHWLSAFLVRQSPSFRNLIPESFATGEPIQSAITV